MNVSRYRWIVVDDPFLCLIIKKKKKRWKKCKNKKVECKYELLPTRKSSVTKRYSEF